MPTQAPEGKEVPTKLSLTSSGLSSSSTAEMEKGSIQKQPVGQAKTESPQLGQSNRTLSGAQSMAPLLLNQPRGLSQPIALSSTASLQSAKHLNQSNLFLRLLSQLNITTIYGIDSNDSIANEDHVNQLVKVIISILNSAKLTNWNKSKDQLENGFTAEQGKLLQLIVDTLFKCIFVHFIETKALVLQVCTYFPTTIGPTVYQKLFEALPKLIEQATSGLEWICQLNKSYCDSVKNEAKQGGTEVDCTVIKDRYSNENIVLTSAEPEQLFTPDHMCSDSKLSSEFTLLSVIKLSEQIRKLIKEDIKIQNDYKQLAEWNLLEDKLNKCLEVLCLLSPWQLACLQSVIEAFLLVQAPPPPLKPQSEVDPSLEQQLAHLNQFVNQLPVHSNQASTEKENSDKAAKSIAPKLFNFVTTNRVALNQILRQHSGVDHWASGPFRALAEYSQLLDFDMKRVFFRYELSRLVSQSLDTLRLNINRSNLLEDSFHQLAFRPVSEWKKPIQVNFIDEHAVDAGGLLREWYLVISRDIFNQNYALFSPRGDQAIYTINSSSHCNPNHLDYFKFFGRLIGKAILDRQLLECYFTRSLYKHILGKTIKYTDMEQEDNEYYKGLVYLLQHKLTDIPSGTDMRFVYESQEFGEQKTVELVVDGQNVPVTDENKHIYVKLVCLQKMTGSIRTQLRAFLEGFYSLVPKRVISIFNEHELELLISGLPTIDLDGLRRSVSYSGFDENEPQMEWLWTALKSFDQTDQAKFLQFVTGTSKVPLGGREGERCITISRDYCVNSAERLPSAYTCSMHLVLPVYESYDKQRTMILKAIQEGSEGFAFS